MPKTDDVDLILAQWAQERGDVNSQPLAVVSRVDRISKRMTRRGARLLAALDLETWEFEVLAALLRQGMPYALSASALAEATLLSTAAMTNRIDKLEKKGLIQRSSNPQDRRGVLVSLTQNGQTLSNRAIEVSFSDAEQCLSALNAQEQRSLVRLLRKLLTQLETNERT